MGTNPDPKYVVTWKRMRRWRNAFLALGFTPLVAAAVVGWLAGNYGLFLLVFVALTVLVYAISYTCHATNTPKFPCPRCGKRIGGPKFFPKKLECYWCGLPFNAPCDPDAAQ